MAAVIGPSLIAVAVTATNNFALFDDQPPDAVYLRGMMFFVLGLVVIVLHNRWSRTWRMLIPLSGWTIGAVGLYHMIWPNGPHLQSGLAVSFTCAVVGAIGAVLSFQGFKHRVLRRA